jgi:hypothetical protein
MIHESCDIPCEAAWRYTVVPMIGPNAECDAARDGGAGRAGNGSAKAQSRIVGLFPRRTIR